MVAKTCQLSRARKIVSLYHRFSVSQTTIGVLLQWLADWQCLKSYFGTF